MATKSKETNLADLNEVEEKTVEPEFERLPEIIDEQIVTPSRIVDKLRKRLSGLT